MQTKNHGDLQTMIRGRFFDAHPELKRDAPEDERQAMLAYFAQKEQEKRRSLKKHLEFFTDAVVAIIITVMVLEIPLPIGTEGDLPAFYNCSV